MKEMKEPIKFTMDKDNKMTIIIVMKMDSPYTDIENFKFEPLASVKAKLSEFNNLVTRQNLFVVVTKNGRPQTVLIKFDLLKKLLKQVRPMKLYFEPSLLKRKKRHPLKEKWLRKWNQLGFYEKV